jgi:hypothetical protein
VPPHVDAEEPSAAAGVASSIRRDGRCMNEPSVGEYGLRKRSATASLDDQL